MNQKPSIQELYHFGIPGMKWGRRRDVPKSYVKADKAIRKHWKEKRYRKKKGLSDSYSTGAYKRDWWLVGNGGRKRINKTLKSGGDRATAYAKEYKRRAIKSAIIAGTGFAAKKAANVAFRKHINIDIHD